MATNLFEYLARNHTRGKHAPIKICRRSPVWLRKHKSDKKEKKRCIWDEKVTLEAALERVQSMEIKQLGRTITMNAPPAICTVCQGKTWICKKPEDKGSGLCKPDEPAHIKDWHKPCPTHGQDFFKGLADLNKEVEGKEGDLTRSGCMRSLSNIIVDKELRDLCQTELGEPIGESGEMATVPILERRRLNEFTGRSLINRLMREEARASVAVSYDDTLRIYSQ